MGELGSVGVYLAPFQIHATVDLMLPSILKRNCQYRGQHKVYAQCLYVNRDSTMRNKIVNFGVAVAVWLYGKTLLQ